MFIFELHDFTLLYWSELLTVLCVIFGGFCNEIYIHSCVSICGRAYAVAVAVCSAYAVAVAAYADVVVCVLGGAGRGSFGFAV